MNQAITTEPIRLVGWDGSDVPATDDDVEGEALHAPTVRRMIAALRAMSAGNSADILERQIERGWVKLPDDDERVIYCNRMREFADFLQSAPDVPIPNVGTEWSRLLLPVTVDWRLTGDEEKAAKRAALAKIVRALPGKVDKVFDENYLNVNGVAGLYVQAYVPRDTVCKRVETTVEKTRLVLPPEHRDVKLIEETYEAVEVEWVCDEPILGGVR